VVNPEQGFRVLPTAEGDRAWFLKLEEADADSRQRWGQLPPHFWGVAGEAKEGATALASLQELEGPRRLPGERAKAAEPEDAPKAVVVRQNYGFGRVLYVGLDSTWRWRFKAGDVYHHRFWGQVATWAGSDKLLPAQNATGTVRFGPREAVTRQGQDVDLLVRFGEPVRKLAPEALKGARVIRLGKAAGETEAAVGLVPLTPPAGQPRELEGRVRDLTPGRYAVELVIPDLGDELRGQSGTPRATFEVLPPEGEELADLSVNLPLLEEIAAKSGGAVYTPETVGGLIDRLAEQSATRSYTVETKLWQSWAALVLFVLMMAAEWGVRKWAGLP
jgi:hypothetical protein